MACSVNNVQGTMFHWSQAGSNHASGQPTNISNESDGLVWVRGTEAIFKLDYVRRSRVESSLVGESG